ncbi:peroxide stress protein YaaA [Actinocorallia sp. API 0066]|uniref:peroxide stress protein YaaA n=1 Tax=Actinocorallia sp. API 0066 TaxID=2896846 RepID=UPI001E2EE8C0|nr:peroxide stress protein YaaA [Actinocorallia sp. API 0066]MCD0451834.1 peroxide stress protein YaaA [Actinocorallia sp. API 0066]
MLILLPPSEGKAPSGDGPPLDLQKLSYESLTPVRARVLDSLVRLCDGPQETAQAVLGLTDGQRDALDRNRRLREAPTLRAAELYTGVLYDNLRLAELDAAARAKVLIFSGLWGVLRPDDRIPPYRLAMGVRLPPLGALAGVWRAALHEAVQPDGLVVDMRSAPYAAAWKRPSVGVRVLRERVVDGVVRRSVVSHMAKATRGAVARDLLVHGIEAATPEELAKALSELGHAVELGAGGIDVVLSEPSR